MLGWLTSWLPWRKRPRPAHAPVVAIAAPATGPRLERIVLGEGVARTLFEDYQEHRRSPRGHEEIGWILLGLRQGNEAIALAALPAGAERDAGAAHVQFNGEAQALASRIIRQNDKRLRVVAVVHTHPGSMRWPSSGDLQGDREWVAQLRDGEGVFAIGTADASPDEPTGGVALVVADLRFSWYALAVGEARYRPLPVQIAAGPDLARPLRPVREAIEAFADPLNRLARQCAKVAFEVIDEAPRTPDPLPRGRGESCILCVKISLAEPRQQIRLLLNDREARYYWDRDGELIAIDPNEPQVDRAVYLILAELAKEFAGYETRTLVESYSHHEKE